jgi:hypothetical protein
MNLRPFLAHATPVVPEPINGFADGLAFIGKPVYKPFCMHQSAPTWMSVRVQRPPATITPRRFRSMSSAWVRLFATPISSPRRSHAPQFFGPLPPSPFPREGCGIPSGFDAAGRCRLDTANVCTEDAAFGSRVGPDDLTRRRLRRCRGVGFGC